MKYGSFAEKFIAFATSANGFKGLQRIKEINGKALGVLSLFMGETTEPLVLH
jgi:hypothetical protein